MKEKEVQTKAAEAGAELELMYALRKFIVAKNGEKWFEKKFPYDANLIELIGVARTTYYNTFEPWPETKMIRTKTEEDIT